MVDFNFDTYGLTAGEVELAFNSLVSSYLKVKNDYDSISACYFEYSNFILDPEDDEESISDQLQDYVELKKRYHEVKEKLRIRSDLLSEYVVSFKDYIRFEEKETKPDPPAPECTTSHSQDQP